MHFAAIKQPRSPRPNGRANAAGMVAGGYSNDNCNQYAPTCNIKSTDGTVMPPDGTLILFQPPGTILTSSFPGSPIDGRSLAVPHWISTRTTNISINDIGVFAGSYCFDRNNQIKRFARSAILSQHMTPAPSSALHRLNAGGIRVGLTLHALSGLNK